MKASNAFKDTIKAYLDKRASEDELFSSTYKKENKNLEECCNYVMQCAKAGGCAGYSDDEVFGWAVHYYDEDDIKNIKPVNAKVIVNHHVEPEKSQHKADNMIIQEKIKKQPKKKKEDPESSEQVSLFEL